jgi:hypothetical protein
MFIDRTQSAAKRQGPARPIKTHMFPAPRAGLIANDNIANPNPESATILDNFYPTAKTVRLRRGSELHATVDTGAGTVFHLTTYEFGGTAKMFAATSTEIFDVTSPASATAEPTPSVTGMTSGDWVSSQFTTTGGHYLLMVNGSDKMLHYDGTYWAQVGLNAAVTRLNYDAETQTFVAGATLTGGTSGHTATIQSVIDNGTTGTLILSGATGVFQDNETITGSGSGGSATANGTAVSVVGAFTGVNPATLTNVWEHKSRLWFIESGTLSAWYLPVDSRTGAAVEFPLQGVFHRGGVLTIGATWSVDSGSGLDDLQVFITDQGEVAVYAGTDPSDSTKWSLVGVYQIGRPMGRKAFFQAGGDLAVITDDGIVPISQALQKDRAALSASAITYPIEDKWRAFVKQDSASVPAFEGVLWGLEAMFLITMPQIVGEENFCYIANSRTGAWARYTGWDARCFALLGNQCYFGTSDGTIYQAEVGGSDNGTAYTGKILMRHQALKSAAIKNATRCRAQFLANRTFQPRIFCLADYSEDLPVAGSNTMSESVGVWGTANWGEFVWQSGVIEYQTFSLWETVYASGNFLAPGIQIVSGITSEPFVELIGLWLQYEEGNIL